MKILLTNHYAGTLEYGGATRPYQLAKEWVRAGHEVTIVAASWVHGRGAPPSVEGSITVEYVDGIRYIWLKTPIYSGNGLRRVANMMTFVGQLWRYGTRLAEEVEPDVVISSSNYPLDAIPAHRIARLSECAYIVEVHDLWPLTPIELGGHSPNHPFIRLLQYAEDYSYRCAHRVVSMLPDAAGHMRDHGMAPHKFAHVPNGVHVAEWKVDPSLLPQEHVETLTRLEEEGRFLIGYAGAHGIPNSLETLVESAALLRAEPVSFVLIGRGVRKPALEERARVLGLTNVDFLPPIPKVAVPAFLDRMDALYLGLVRSPLYRFGISLNKMFEYMMAAKPVIFAADASNNPIADNEAGVSPGAENPQAVADAVRWLVKRSAAERAEMGHRGREFVRSRHDYPHLANRFLRIMEEARAQRSRDRQKTV